MACRQDAMQPSLAPGCELRAMTRQDVPQVIAIERRSYGYPWTEGIFNDCLRVAYHAAVALHGGVIVGYVIMNEIVGEAHILNLCVDPQWRGRGIGRCLLEHAIETARGLKAISLFLEVRESNQTAIRLYQRCGFSEIGVRRNYYPAPVGYEDAIMLSKQLDLERF